MRSTVYWAFPIASSMAGKISSPLRRTVIALPSVKWTPTRHSRERRNCRRVFSLASDVALLSSNAVRLLPGPTMYVRHPRSRKAACWGIQTAVPSSQSVVPVHRARREGRHADRYVLRAVRSRTAVPHPLAGPGVHRLPGLDRQLAVIRVHHQRSPQHDGELVELRALTGLGPARRAAHVRDAHGGLARVGLPHVLIDQLGRLAGRGDPARLADQFRHDRSIPQPGVYRYQG